MSFKHSALACAVGAFASAFCASAAQAQSAADFEQLRQELKRLKEEMQNLKVQKAPAPAVDAAAINDRVEQLEIKSKDAVVAGDIGGGLRIPGSETSVHLYGYAEAHLVHDLKAPGPSDLFTDLSFQPLDSADVPHGRTRLTASTSRLGLETSTPTSTGTFNTRLEMDFYSYGDGNRNRLRLRHAYGEYHGFLVGQTWSTFMDLDDLPETVDFNGPIGAPFSRRTMIRYTYGDPRAGYKLTVALEDPQDQFGGGSQAERLPQFVARFDKSFDWGAINMRGLVHEKRSATETRRGYGVGIGGSYKLSDKDLLMAQYTRVDGDIDQLYGSNGYAIDGTTGTISFDRNRGFVAGYNRNFSDSLRGTVAFGMNKGKTAAAIDNRSLRQLFVNLIYSPIKNVELGGEYVHGRRETFTGEVGTMSRIDLMGRYSF
ncbi:DcaP family trimeric outer membrane transporter [Piscinibacter terrae]|uniref:Porin n=1 Tax=Piscinibacter terrae TaxID=2496871 RepID=A0A3N7HVY8_9BURK|nr:DcaP family trimeric outer membrane transporter [Albitalea terrae]RQP25546.1 porin [Albitalea terrae]